jgi:NAD(P)-dependent dehydrogenase (short-subunit alcohol dehydrogenase family)
VSSVPVPAEPSVLVVGARGGIGREICALAAARRMRVHPIDRDEIDLRDSASVAPYIDQLWAAHGPFDGVVYAAGLFPAAPILETPATVFDDVFAVNTRAALEVGAAAARCAVATQHPLSLVYLSQPGREPGTPRDGRVCDQPDPRLLREGDGTGLPRRSGRGAGGHRAGRTVAARRRVGVDHGADPGGRRWRAG